MAVWKGITLNGLTLERSFADKKLLLLTPKIFPVPEKHLKHSIGSLAHFSDQILGALDVAINES